jgi:cytosine deaminase
VSSLLVRGARLVPGEEPRDLLVLDGVIARVGSRLEAPAGAEVIDAAGGWVRPPFVEPHVHLDATLSLSEATRNRTGTLWEGIRRWTEIKPTLTREDVLGRAEELVRWQVAHGVLHVRSHVDAGDPGHVALRALVELRERLRGVVELQLVAFPQEGIVSRPDGRELLEEALALGADVVGGIPHYESTRERAVRSLELVWELAERHGLPVDVHCDEVDDPASRNLEVMAALALETGTGPRVTASHTTAMGSYDDSYADKVIHLARRAGISVVANPLVNITLQGRFDTYPKRRGLTRVKELWRAGVNVALGHDDVLDPWYPLGTADPLAVASMGIHAAHMTAPEEMVEALEMVSARAARALGLEDRYGLEVGRPGSFVVLDADDAIDLLRRGPLPRWVVSHGRLVAATEPARTEVRLRDSEPVDFRRRPRDHYARRAGAGGGR